MNATRKNGALQEALERAGIARAMLRKVSQGNYRIMEELHDKVGIVTERWIIGTGPMGETIVEVVVMATPHWWNIYMPVTRSNRLDDTEKALAELVK